MHACTVCKIYGILNRIFTIIVCAHMYLPNIQVKFLIMPLVLLVDHGAVSEGEHSDPPSQKRRSDNGNP